MATLTYTISKTINEIGRSEIYIRFSASRENRFRVKSGYFVPVNRWLPHKNMLSIPKINTPERKELLELDETLTNLKKHIFESYEQSDKSRLSKEWLMICVDQFKYPEKYVDQGSDFFDAYDDFLKRRNFSDMRFRMNKVVYRLMKRLELYKRKTSPEFKLTFSCFNKAFISEIGDYIKNEYVYISKYPDILIQQPESRIPEQRGQNTIHDRLKILRAFLNWCVDNELIPENPFKKFQITESVYGTPYYISIEERNMIYNHDFSDKKHLAVQRDIFVFQCLIGCRVGDLILLKKSNIINDAVEYIARKSKDGNPVTVRVPLNGLAKEIIARYANESTEQLLPFISSQKYNDSIKEIFTEVKITRPVTILSQLTREQIQVPLNEIASSHLARRTFIGNLYKQVKDPNLVGSLSGHREGSKAFARYRDIDDDIKSELVNLLL
jgi:integrase